MIVTGDAIEEMQRLVFADAVLADLPYGTTQNAWDSVLDLGKFWEAVWDLLPDAGPVICTAAQPFTSVLVMSQLRYFRHDWIWEKTSATGHLNAKKAPMRAHESILVFCRKAPAYFPQKTDGHRPVNKFLKRRDSGTNYGRTTGTVGGGGNTDRYPRSVQVFASDKQRSGLHPTQKPVALLRYLLRTYTRPGETVLDPTCGSGSTGVACAEEGRGFIGIEKDARMADVARHRLSTPPP